MIFEVHHRELGLMKRCSSEREAVAYCHAETGLEGKHRYGAFLLIGEYLIAARSHLVCGWNKCGWMAAWYSYDGEPAVIRDSIRRLADAAGQLDPEEPIFISVDGEMLQE